MLLTHSGKALAGALIAVATMLGSAGPAQAAVYKGAWDPAFGTPFTSLGWSGISDYYIPDSCLVGVTTGMVTCSGMTAGFAQVTLQTPATGTPTSTSLLSFNQKVAVTQAYFLDGTLEWVNSAIFDLKSTHFSAAGGGAYDFALKFSASGAELFYSKDQGCHDCDLTKITSPTQNTEDCGVSDFIHNPATVTFTPAVPEPQTYALMLAGIGAIGFLARRRRQ